MTFLASGRAGWAAVCRLVSKVLDHHLQLDLIAGMHYEDYSAAFPTATGNGPRVTYTGTMPLAAFRNAVAVRFRTFPYHSAPVSALIA